MTSTRPVVEGGLDVAVRRERRSAGEGGLLARPGLLRDPDGDAALLRLRGDLLEQRADDLVAVREHPDAPAGAHEIHDHLRAGRGLAGAGRTLDREDAGRHGHDDPPCGIRHGLVRAREVARRAAGRPREAEAG